MFTFCPGLLSQMKKQVLWWAWRWQNRTPSRTQHFSYALKRKLKCLGTRIYFYRLKSRSLSSGKIDLFLLSSPKLGTPCVGPGRTSRNGDSGKGELQGLVSVEPCSRILLWHLLLPPLKSWPAFGCSSCCSFITCWQMPPGCRGLGSPLWCGVSAHQFPADALLSLLPSEVASALSSRQFITEKWRAWNRGPDCVG